MCIILSVKRKDKLGDKFKKTDIQKTVYPFPDGMFDVVFSKSVIEHLREPDWLFSQSFRLLRPGGVIITMVPSYKHGYREQFYIDHTHHTPFTRHSLKVINELNGFKDVKSNYLYQLPFLWKHPYLFPVVKLIQMLRLPYRPFYNAPWSDNVNKLLRFSTEAMLISVARKP